MENMIELVFSSVIPGSERAGVLSAMMFEAGCDGISENENGISVFFGEETFSRNNKLVAEAAGKDAFKKVIHAPRNWNIEWEKNYPMVTISGKVVIYAPFHSEIPDFPYRILLNPGMAFGTGHHSTTSLMIRLMLDTDIKNKPVIDMGCGSGVLAIMASLMGAEKVYAIDNDRNSYENCQQNVTANSCENIECIEGNAASLKGIKAGVFIANITRNILIKDFDAYFNCTDTGGIMMFSGFLKEDTEMFRAKVSEYKMEEVTVLYENEWAAIAFRKK